MQYVIYSVEDDKNISHLINVALTKQGFYVESFANGQDFLTRFNNEKPNLILLDMMLPDIQGQDILKTIRSDEANDDIQIIIVSANRMVMDKVDGLDLGADDYLEKPFNIMELISRVNAKARRFLKNQNIVIGPYQLDLKSHSFLINNKCIDLTNKEFEILEILMKHNGEVISRDKIYSLIWGNHEIESRSIDMHIKSLRKKINDENGNIIKSIYGIGYKFDI